VKKTSIVSAAEYLFGNVTWVIVLSYAVSVCQYSMCRTPLALLMIFLDTPFLRLGYV
jgi:hypothetical protein